MCGNGVFIAFAALLVTIYARPDGYGVKGGGHDRFTGNAFASAHASANAAAGGFGIAQSSATATANAESRGGETSRADATANASVDGGNIGKAIDENANGNANGMIDSGDLHKSNDHGKDMEYQWISHEGGTTGLNNPIANAGHAAFNVGTEKSGWTGEGHDHRGCGGVVEGLKGHGGVSRCGDQTACKGNKPSSPGSQHSMEDAADYRGNTQKTDGNAGVSHAGSPCAPGDSKCFANKPSVSSPYPTYEKNPDLSAGSSSSTGIDGGYRGNTQKTDGNAGVSHAGRPCAPGDSKCFANKPSVSSPYPTYEKNPDLSAGSSSSTGIDGGYRGNTQKTDGNAGVSHAGSPCAPGDSKCFANKPSVSSPYPTYEKNPHLSAGSSSSTGIDGGYRGNTQKTDGNAGVSHAGSPCAPGDSKCFANKPSVSSPYPTYEKNPELSAGSSSSTGIDGGYRGNTQKTDGNAGVSHAGSPCAPGDSKCFANKPSVSNPYPTYEKNPDLSAGSSSSTGIDGGYGGNAQKTGNAGVNHAGSPCAPGNFKCFAHKPISSNAEHPGGFLGKGPNTANPFLNGQIDLSNIKDKQYSIKTSNPFLNPHSQVHSATGSNHPVANGHQQNGNIPNAVGYTVTKDSPTTSCHGSVSCLPNKSAGSPSGTPFSTNHVPKVEDNLRPDSSHGQTEFPGKQPKEPNPFLVDGQLSKPESDGGSSLTPENKQSGQNFLPGHSSAHFSLNERKPEIVKDCQSGSSSTSCTDRKTSGEIDLRDSMIQGHGNAGIFDLKPLYADAGNAGAPCTSGDSKCFAHKPNSGDGHSNPFFNGEIDLSGIKHSANSEGLPYTGTDHPGITMGPQQNGKLPNAGDYPVINGSPTTNCHGSVSCSPNKLAVGPSETPLLTNDGPKVEDNWTPGSGHSQTEFQGKQRGEPNPFLINGQLLKSEPDGKSSLTMENVQSGQNPLHGHAHISPNERKPGIIQNCPGGSCDGHKASSDSDVEGSVIQGHGNAGTFSSEDWAVKGHRPGVKGGTGQRGSSTKLQGNSGLGESGHPGNELKGLANADANASAFASAHSNAYASSSSSSSSSQASANAKSEAYSSLGNSGSSNAWSKSSASASASAFANSSQSHQSWTVPVSPQVVAK